MKARRSTLLAEAKGRRWRNWFDFPEDVMLLIFMKLGPMEILFRAQFVCSSWQKLAQEPKLYTCLVMTRCGYFKTDDYDRFTEVGKEVVARSSGELTEIYMEDLVTEELLKYIAEKSNSLKSLRLKHCEDIDEVLEEVVKENPMLEELEFSGCEIGVETIEKVVCSCSQLKSFLLNFDPTRQSEFSRNESDNVAYAIGKNLPQLRRLHLYWNALTDDGLRAILDGCPNLKFLDIRYCENLNLQGVLLQTCLDRMTYFWFGSDSIFGSEAEGDVESYDFDTDINVKDLWSRETY
ncbi:hypothetical protein IFM89_004229 [Coptis chinensis]|uniref:F-box domain-containing protein n=1 Tax=Coptis chinensis TaxID=261450 RepID=A0A835M3N6_9MAGN|nr:hypothetical protein IFM89_004229 [Coptis chinensis]